MDYATKMAEVKRQCDALIGLPNVLMRKGVARDGDPMTGYIDYNYKLYRLEDLSWRFYCEWVDLDGTGHRIFLPHNVVLAILTKAESIKDQTKREAGKRAYAVRQRKALQAAEDEEENGQGEHGLTGS